MRDERPQRVDSDGVESARVEYDHGRLRVEPRLRQVVADPVDRVAGACEEVEVRRESLRRRRVRRGGRAARIARVAADQRDDDVHEHEGADDRADDDPGAPLPAHRAPAPDRTLRQPSRESSTSGARGSRPP